MRSAHVKVQPPRIAGQQTLPVMTAMRLALEARFEATHFQGVEVIDAHAANVSFDESVLEKMVLQNARLEKLHLSDCVVQACDFTAARCAESSFVRVHIRGGRLTGMDLSRSLLQDVTFENCKLDMANFRFARLKRVRFVDCQFREADFQAAELRHVSFESSLLEKVAFGQCQLVEVDARTSQLIDLHGWEYLRGLVIDDMQLAAVAPQLALGLGLIVEP